MKLGTTFNFFFFLSPDMFYLGCQSLASLATLTSRFWRQEQILTRSSAVVAVNNCFSVQSCVQSDAFLLL